MSTRANIVVRKDKKEHTFYRHCDGYIEGLGEDIKDFVKEYKGSADLEKFCQSLDNEGVAELEDCGIHGDVEFVYYIDLYSDNIKISVKALEMTKTASGKWIEKWKIDDSYTENFSYKN